MKNEKDDSKGKYVRLHPGVTEILFLVRVIDENVMRFRDLVDFWGLVPVGPYSLKYSFVYTLAEAEIAKFDLKVVCKKNVF